jgi:hypothetical protein
MPRVSGFAPSSRTKSFHPTLCGLASDMVGGDWISREQALDILGKIFVEGWGTHSADATTFVEKRFDHLCSYLHGHERSGGQVSESALRRAMLDPHVRFGSEPPE